MAVISMDLRLGSVQKDEFSFKMDWIPQSYLLKLSSKEKISIKDTRRKNYILFSILQKLHDITKNISKSVLVPF